MLSRTKWWTLILSTYVIGGGHIRKVADDTSAGSGEACPMSELVRIIDDYRDSHGQPSDASIARAIGIAPQTLSSWRKRGIKEPPEPETMRALARLVGESYEEYVLPAALVDSGFLDAMPPAATKRKGAAS